MKKAHVLTLLVTTLALPLLMAQDKLGGEAVTMSDREQSGLHGSVKSCTELDTRPGSTDAEGKSHPEVRFETTTEYGADGRILAMSSRSTDGSHWVTNYSYDASGRLLRVASGNEGQAPSGTTYSYDQQGRLQSMIDDARPDRPVSFRYDEHGRKTKIAISRPEDYRPHTASAGSPFALAEFPNLPDGGTTTTIYDEQDQPTEIQVRDPDGELISRAVRTYDAQGHIAEEKQISDSPELMFPASMRASMLEQSGLSADQLRQEMHAQIMKLMGGNSGLSAESYEYDTHGRMSHKSRRIFNQKEDIETTYNEHGEIESEITRRVAVAAEPDPAAGSAVSPYYSEVRYSYRYDDRGNWIEKTGSYRSSPEDAWQPSTSVTRTLTYY
jgi:YD repeat-containing protein